MDAGDECHWAAMMSSDCFAGGEKELEAFISSEAWRLISKLRIHSEARWTVRLVNRQIQVLNGEGPWSIIQIPIFRNTATEM